MKINIPKILEEIDLTEHHHAYVDKEGKPVIVHVWVNIPNEKRTVLFGIATEAYRASDLLAQAGKIKAKKAARGKVAEAMGIMDEQRQVRYEIFGELWSQHSDPETHWTPEEVEKLYEDVESLFYFLQERTGTLIQEHREGTKKESAPVSQNSHEPARQANPS